MAGSRTYYRDSHGRFHGSSGGRATTGRAGGFANSAFRQRVIASRSAARPSSSSQKASRSKSFGLGRAVKRAAPKVVTIGVTAAAAGVAANVVRGGGFGRVALGVSGSKGKIHASVSSINGTKSTSLNGVLRLPSGARIPHNVTFR